MECHDVQQLLAFVNRPNEELDAPERAAMHEHLDKCLDCSAIAQAERRADELIGPVLRDVPVPGDLRAKLMKRLAVEKPSSAWKLGSLAVAAAVLLIAVGGGAVWIWWPAMEVDYADVEHMIPFQNTDTKDAEKFFRERGLKVKAPDRFDYRYFQDVEMVDFKGRRVAKMTFSKADRCVASVLILPRKQFRTDNLRDETEAMHIWRDDPVYIYIVVFVGDLEAVLLPKVPA